MIAALAAVCIVIDRYLTKRTTGTLASCSRRVCYMHACPCGFYGDSTRECRCTPATIQRYLGRISGPLLDRIDIHIEVPAVPYKELRSEASVENSATLRGRVAFARNKQAQRGCNNSALPPAGAARALQTRSRRRKNHGNWRCAK